MGRWDGSLAVAYWAECRRCGRPAEHGARRHAAKVLQLVGVDGAGCLMPSGFCRLPLRTQVKEVPAAAAAWADEFDSQQRQQGPSLWGEEFAAFQAQQHPAATGEQWAADFEGEHSLGV